MELWGHEDKLAVVFAVIVEEFRRSTPTAGGRETNSSTRTNRTNRVILEVCNLEDTDTSDFRDRILVEIYSAEPLSKMLREPISKGNYAELKRNKTAQRWGPSIKMTRESVVVVEEE